MKRWERLAIAAALIHVGVRALPDVAGPARQGDLPQLLHDRLGRQLPVDGARLEDTRSPTSTSRCSRSGDGRATCRTRPTCAGDIGIGMVKERIAKARAANPGEEGLAQLGNRGVDRHHHLLPDEPPGLGADIVSIDSYGGIWDWDAHLKHRLGQMYRLLEPGQMMGLVPEAFRYPAARHRLRADRLRDARLAVLRVGLRAPRRPGVRARARSRGRAGRRARHGGQPQIAAFDVCMADMPQVAQVWAASRG